MLQRQSDPVSISATFHPSPPSGIALNFGNFAQHPPMQAADCLLSPLLLFITLQTRYFTAAWIHCLLVSQKLRFIEADTNKSRQVRRVAPGLLHLRLGACRECGEGHSGNDKDGSTWLRHKCQSGQNEDPTACQLFSKNRKSGAVRERVSCKSRSIPEPGRVETTRAKGPHCRFCRPGARTLVKNLV